LVFKDRFDAGEQLAKALAKFKKEDCVVLAIPRGGLQIGFVVAKKLCFPLEVILTKKIGHPYNPEFAIGAVGLFDMIVSSEAKEAPQEYIDKQTKEIRELLVERQKMYMGARRPASLNGKTVIIVDDGIATGTTMLLTVKLVRKSNPKKVIVAIPVAPPDAVKRIGEEADEVVCLSKPVLFSAVGEFYGMFPQVSDETAIGLLKEANDWVRQKRRASKSK